MVIAVVKLETHLFTNITLSHDRWLAWLDGCGQLKSQLAKIGGHCPSEGEDKAVLKKITGSHDQWVTWISGWDTLILNHKCYSKSNRTQRQKYICSTLWGKIMLQVGAALFYYELEQMLLQIGAKFITNWDRYYKLGQLLLGHNNIHQLASLRFLKLYLTCQNIQMGRRTCEDLFFSFVGLCSKSASCNQTPRLFLLLQSFFKK